MKLDKIKFAALISSISKHTGITFDNDDLRMIDELIDIEINEEPIVLRPANPEIERLMAFMAAGIHKIEAIKVHRQITGMGLKESKDMVEKYWTAKPADSLAQFKD